MATVFCNQCGAPNVEGSAFCAKCGRAIQVLPSATATAESRAPVVSAPAPAGVPPGQGGPAALARGGGVGPVPKRTLVLAVILGGVLVVAGVIVLVSAVANTRSAAPDPGAAATPPVQPPAERARPLKPYCGGYDSVAGKYAQCNPGQKCVAVSVRHGAMDVRQEWECR